MIRGFTFLSLKPMLYVLNLGEKDAARANAAPTLMRRTPSAAASASDIHGPVTRRFTGFGATALTTASMSSFVRMPGAYKQSAPAAA